MQRVNRIEPSGDSLAEARERVEELMKKRESEEYNFDSRLQEAVKEVREGHQEARKVIEDSTSDAFNEFHRMRNRVYIDCRNCGVNRVPQS